MNRKSIAKTAAEIDEKIIRRISDCEEKIKTCEREIDRIEGLRMKTEAGEVAALLAPARRASEAAQHALDQYVRDGGRVFLSRTGTGLKRARDDAASALAKVRAGADSPTAARARTARVAGHNDAVDEARAQLPVLRRDKSLACDLQTSLDALSRDIRQALHAATSTGWLADDFGTRLCEILDHLQGDDVEPAQQCVSRLRFQVKPTEASYQTLQQEAASQLDAAYGRYSGFAATGGYHERIALSVQSGLSALRPTQVNSISGWHHPTDRWQAPYAQTADPLAL